MSILIKRIGTCVLALVMLGAWISGSAAQEPQPPAAPARSIYLPLMMEDIPGEWIGPGGGLIAALAISPSSPSIVYAGSWGGGLYKSPDGGGTWAWKSQGLLNQTVVSIAVDPTRPERRLHWHLPGQSLQDHRRGRILVPRQRGHPGAGDRLFHRDRPGESAAHLHRHAGNFQ